jgi:hypothetical protein
MRGPYGILGLVVTILVVIVILRLLNLILNSDLSTLTSTGRFKICVTAAMRRRRLRSPRRIAARANRGDSGGHRTPFRLSALGAGVHSSEIRLRHTITTTAAASNTIPLICSVSMTCWTGSRRPRTTYDRSARAYLGLQMEGPIARWYARNTGRDTRRFIETAEQIAGRLPAGSCVLEVAPGPGYLSIEMARRGYTVTGLDIRRRRWIVKRPANDLACTGELRRGLAFTRL